MLQYRSRKEEYSGQLPEDFLFDKNHLKPAILLPQASSIRPVLCCKVQNHDLLSDTVVIEQAPCFSLTLHNKQYYFQPTTCYHPGHAQEMRAVWMMLQAVQASKLLLTQWKGS